MQKLPRFSKAALILAITFAALQLRNVASGWQEPASPQPAPHQASESAAAPAANPEATALVQAARQRLASWRSIQANVIQRTDVGDRRYKATGRFVAGEFPRLRLEYEVTVGSTIGRLLEVCDGQVLHIERRIESAAPAVATGSEAAELTSKDASKPAIEAMRRDVQRILRAASDAEGAAVSMHAADIGLGGISALLASLERTMIFDSIRDEEHDGQRFRVVQGVWNPEQLTKLQTQLGGLSQQLAMFLPERVRIYFEAESLFPVRILYLKLASTERRAYRAMLSLEFHDVEFDADIPLDTFSYRPPTGVQQRDDTEDYVQLLKATQGQAPTADPSASSGETLNVRRPTDSLPRSK